ncbi:presqualene diphosphate synthase HpnD [Melioribacter sp. OK-6-Me]|uniref:presqualene diphosphate synthase HpnD n=1 Tax=unclassified Melioribacter TaxID=2627329 RepID=UPI003ED93A9D
MKDEAKQIAQKSRSSFYYAFSLLESEKRDAMNAVYAFCRTTDDIVDETTEPDDIKYEKLRMWRLEFEKGLRGCSNYPLLNKLNLIIRRFNIPIDPFFELIEGMEMDLQKKSYLSFDDLLQYCYRVASTVGLMCIEIFGYKNHSAKDYAINLGIALQLTNIIRDVGKDVENNRIYIPRYDLDKFDYSIEDLRRKKYNDKFVQLMKYESQRAEYYFQKANNSLDFEDKPMMFPARAMQHIYEKLLRKIQKANYDVLNNYIRVSSGEKIALSLGTWIKYNLVY